MNTEQLLKDIRFNATTIISNLLPLMHTISTENNDVVKEICERTGASDLVVTKYMEDKLTEITKEPKKLMKELSGDITPFIQAPKRGNVRFKYISQVWFGDVYDGLEGNLALEKLRLDLIEQTQTHSESAIIEEAVMDLS